MKTSIKNDIVWLLLTVMILIVISIVQMYSRDITLDKVHRTEFNLIYKLLNENSEINKYALPSILSPLLTRQKFALFHVAIISESSCSENTKHYYNNPFFCSIFKDLDDLKPYISFEEIETSSIIEEKSSGSYLLRKFSNSNEFLIAKTNFYSTNSELSNFIYFILHRYYQTNGYIKILEKGKFLFITIFLVSFVLWILNKLQHIRYQNKYQAYREQEHRLQSKLYDIDTKYNDLKRLKYENETMIEEVELKLKNTHFQSDLEKKELENSIIALEISKKEIEKLFEDNEDLIEALERETIDLRKTIHLQLKKLELHKQNQTNDLTYEKLQELEKLWRREPTWTDRKKIESLVSLKETNLPFTITQGFIAFDKMVLKIVKQHDPDIVESQTNLITNIKIVFTNNILPLKYEQKFHDIRKARNEWFHAGIYPKLETIDFLVNVLQDTDADVFI